MLRDLVAANQPNTFIGGVGATSVTSAADFVAITTGITTSNISNFSIDSNNNVSFYVDSAYFLDENAFDLDTDITYFIDADQLINGHGTKSLGNTTNLIYYYGGLLSGSLNDGISRNFISSGILNCFSPLSVTLGFDGGNDAVFQSTAMENLIVNTSAQTSNGGGVESDVQGEIAKGTNVLYASNTTAPSAVSDLASVDVYGSLISMTMSAPSSSNTILGYEVWVNGAFLRFVETLDFTLTDLTLNTTYDIYVHTVDEHGNRSGKSNTVSETTSATYVIPTANIISYWDFDSDSTDQVGANDGTDTSMSYVSSGGIGNVANFTASTSSKIEVADAANLSFGNTTTDSPFSLTCRVKYNSVTNSFYFSKQTDGTREYQLGLVSTNILRFRLYDDTVSNYIQASVTWTPTTGVWYEITTTYDGSGNASGIKIYRDGVLLTTTNDETGTYVAMSDTTQPLTLGKYSFDTAFSLNGYEDELAIFDKELSALEVYEIYAKHQVGLALTE